MATNRTGASIRRVTQAAERKAAAKQELIHAPNWRTPIIIDVVLGMIVAIIGAILAIVWSPLPGGAIGAAGATYVVMAYKRFKDWSQQRRAAQDTD